MRSAIFLPLLLAGFSVAQAATEPLFDEHADATRQIEAAIQQAGREHKNIVLDFGANWCGDCHALEAQMHKPDLASVIEKNYVVVKVDVGNFDKNLDVADKYHVPIRRTIANMLKHTGIPALAVLDSQGKLLYANGHEFADAGNMRDDDFRTFFEKWRPK